MDPSMEWHALLICSTLGHCAHNYLKQGCVGSGGGWGGEVNAALWREQRGTVKLGKHHNVLAAELNNVLATVLNLLRQFYLLILA